jgi:hypothetical protein
MGLYDQRELRETHRMGQKGFVENRRIPTKTEGLTVATRAVPIKVDPGTREAIQGNPRSGEERICSSIILS